MKNAMNVQKREHYDLINQSVFASASEEVHTIGIADNCLILKLVQLRPKANVKYHYYSSKISRAV